MKALGKLKPFYRNAAILSEFVSIGGLEAGGDLSPIPEYLMSGEIDFPYKKKADEEILFTDHVTLVRFLGGISDKRIRREEEKGGNLDLAYRDVNGSIKIRRNLIERYRPFVQLYKTEITVVLDNIPRVFSKSDYIDDYGNINPPYDYDEWRKFIKNMCEVMVECFGFDIVNHWRFRIATEGRLNAETVDFCRHYDITTAAILEVLPGARFSPYNIAGISAMAQHKNNMYAIARHCADGTNLATGGKGSPIDFLPVSYYSIPMIDENNRLIPGSLCPITRTSTEYYDYWNKIADMCGHFKEVPREIQELGILTNEYGRQSSEPGARGAAWLFQLLFTMLEKNNLSKAWHWHTTDVLAVPGKCREEYKRILRSDGWLYSILDHLEGSDAYALEAGFAAPCDGMVTLKAVGFSGERKHVVISAFNLNRSMIYNGFVYIDIPWEFCRAKPGSEMNYVSLSAENDVYTSIYNDLQANNLLKKEVPILFRLTKTEKYFDEAFYSENITDIPGSMYPVYEPDHGVLTSEKGMEYLEGNWEAYESIIKDSLKLKPFKAKVYEADGYSRIYFRMKTPETVVIELPN